jgi:site-specific DNA recombinase
LKLFNNRDAEVDMKTAYAYARFSSDNQREESIDAQVRAIKEYCEREGILLLRVFKDEAVSARTAKRPAFQDMFGLIKEHPADLLIVHKLDRFARNRADAAFYRSKLKEAGMKLVSVLERLDDSPESIIMEGILESMNEYYSANLSREARKGLKENMINGKRNGGKAPLGYDAVNQHLVPNSKARIITGLFQMYADGKSYKEMIAFSGFPHANIRNILSNEVYLGHLVFGEWRSENAHEPLVDQDTWGRCRRRMSTAAGNASNRAKHDYMLSRMLVCGRCGKTINGISSNGHLYYACRSKGCKFYRKEDLEKRVIDLLAKHLRPTDEIKARFFALVSERVNNREKVEQAEKSNIILRQRIQRITNAVQYADDETAVDLLNQVKELKKQIVPVPKPREIKKDVCDAYIEEFRNLENMSYENQKTTVIRLISKIVVNGDDMILYTTRDREAYCLVNKDGLS